MRVWSKFGAIRSLCQLSDESHADKPDCPTGRRTACELAAQQVMICLADPLVRCALMAAWLLPCAWQDLRTRHVSNWLTIPLFVIAWPVALLTGNLALVFAVFVGTWVAWRAGAGMGGADGKIAVGLAALAPEALFVGFCLQIGVFMVWRLREKTGVSIPGALWFCVGALLATAGRLILLRYS